MKMLFSKVKFLSVLFILTTQLINAQSTEQGLKVLDRENYQSARTIFMSLAKSNGSDAMNWYYLGNTFCFLDKNDSARWAFSQGLAANPKSTACLVGMGKTYLNENKTADAVKSFDEAKSTVNVNKDINIAIYLGDAYINSTHPNPAEAIKILNDAVNNINVKTPQPFILLGDANLAINEAGQAVTSYQRAAEIDKSIARPHYKIGVIWDMAKNFNLSLQSFNTAISTDSTFAPAYRGLAELYYNTNQYSKAEATFAKYLSLADKSDETQYQYAQFLFLSKDYAKALTIINQLLQKGKSREVMYRIAGYSNYQLGNYSEAVKNMEMFFQKADGKNVLASDYEYYGNSLSKTGKDSLGIVNLEKAIKLDSTRALPIYGGIADTLYKMKKYGQAAIYYQKKINKEPKPDFRDYFSEGRAYYFDSAYKKSDSAFGMVTKLIPAWIQGYLFRARADMHLEGDSVKGYAIPYYDSVVVKGLVDTVKYKAELQEAYRGLADLNYNMGNRTEAVGYYQKYLTTSPPDADYVRGLIESIKNGKKATSPKATPKK